MKRPAIYGRTSSDGQETGLEAQLMACRDRCTALGLADPVEFTDDGVSGAEEHRPGLDALLAAARRGEISHVVFYSLSRLSRDWIHSWRFVTEFQELGVQLVCLNDSIDLESPEGRLFFKIMAAINEYGREDTVRKVMNGLENARRKGVKLGRKQTRDDAAILALVDQGKSPTDVARELGVKRGAIYRALEARSRPK
jgi:DNA invertase Pin-like site-specific DNA recombinase